jgi:hypothetical protein
MVERFVQLAAPFFQMDPRPAISGARCGRRAKGFAGCGQPQDQRDWPRTPGVPGGCLLDGPKERGWETEALTLRASLNRAAGESEPLSAVERAGLILLATKAPAAIASHRRAGRGPSAERLVGIVYSGFPGTCQNSVALAICRELAAQSGFMWAGGLAPGGGGMTGGQPPTGTKRPGPPIRHVAAALGTGDDRRGTGRAGQGDTPKRLDEL